MSLLQEGPSSREHLVDFSKNRKQLLTVESIRVGFLVVILLITLVLQTVQPQFVNLEVLLPIYGVLFSSFVVHTIYLLNFEKTLTLWLAKAFVFVFDSVAVMGLIFFTGVNNSIFLFLFLVNIILCGLVFHKIGAFTLALLTSILFSMILILAPSLHGQTLFFSLGLNNIAFFTVAYLSGHLSEQLNFMGNELSSQLKDLKVLQNINQYIVENISTGMLTVNSANKVIHCNSAGLKVLEKPEGSVLFKGVDLVFPELSEKFIERMSKTNSFLPFDVKYETTSGKELIFEIIVSKMYGREEKAEGYIFLFQDLTKVRQLEFAMRQSEKLAAVGQLAAGIAHEIRNPLASISGSVELMESMPEGGEDREKLRKIVLREIDRLNGLLSDFLDYVKPDKPKFSRLNLGDILEEVSEVVRLNNTLRDDVELNTDISAQGFIEGDSARLRQALLNIIINSYHALEKEPSPQLKISLTLVDQIVALKISDNGCGMDSESCKRMFEPFHTTKAKGTGLGLAVTHKILENHGAEIFVKSEVGVGTTFSIHFPHADGRKKNSNEHGNNEMTVLKSSAKRELEQEEDSEEDLQYQKRGSG